MELDFLGVVAQSTPEALIMRSAAPLDVLASAVVGGGFSQTRHIINRHVSRSYPCADPQRDLQAFARQQHITEPFIGLLTAVPTEDTVAATARANDLAVAVLVTAGVGNAAAPGLSPPATTQPGTINLILLIDARLTPAAMVNAVITATEAKAHTLLRRNIRSSDGHPATGTSTDAIVVACTGRGAPLIYGGPVTEVGWLIGRTVRTTLEQALDRAAG